MKKYQICEVMKELNHAGSKAPNDIQEIASNLGFRKVFISKSNIKQDIFSKIRRQVNFCQDWNNAYKVISSNSIVLLQHPFRDRQINRDKILLKLKKKKNVKFISLIHDVEEIRKTLYDKYYKDEFNFMLSIADCIIVHNAKMRDFFISKKVPSQKLVNLNIFDYLQKNPKLDLPSFSRSVNIAGNLDENKAEYLKKIGEVDVKFALFGPNYTDHSFKNVVYRGSFPSAEIPSRLNAGFGLIWDGNDIDECTGPTGNYLKYNNPHKLSLYLSSNMPVIIWKNAAEAQFVEKNKVGFTINSLKEISEVINEVTPEKYEDYINNTKIISQKLTTGFYTTHALKKALKIVE